MAKSLMAIPELIPCLPEIVSRGGDGARSLDHYAGATHEVISAFGLLPVRR